MRLGGHLLKARLWVIDESRARLGPGMALRLSVVERCFEQRLEAHEFLGEDMEYKRRFSTSDRAHAGFRAYRRTPLPSGRYAYRRHVRPLLRRAYRRFRGSRTGAPAGLLSTGPV